MKTVTENKMQRSSKVRKVLVIFYFENSIEQCNHYMLLLLFSVVIVVVFCCYYCCCFLYLFFFLGGGGAGWFILLGRNVPLAPLFLLYSVVMLFAVAPLSAKVLLFPFLLDC